MDKEHVTASEQGVLWNGAGGHGWVRAQGLLDQVFKPFDDLLVDATLGGSAGSVLDVGCGTGSTTVAIARRLRQEGDCIGIDISEPMVAAARSRAEREGVRARFVQADAQRHPFEPGRFSAIVSRFGLMFFDDFVQAFANLHAAVRSESALRFVAWRTPDENRFMTTAESAAAPLLAIPPREPGARGQFAFADRQRIDAILTQGGWADIDIQPIDIACAFPATELDRYLTLLGPLGRALAVVDMPTRAHVVEAVRPAFDCYIDGRDVRFTAACWWVQATA